MKIFAAVPAHDGRLCVETAKALLNEQSAAALAGIEMAYAFLPGCSLITHARNQIVRDFLASDADRLVFVDSDVAWSVGELLKLASHAVDVVGGAYRFKEEGERYPVLWLDKKDLWAENGLLEVASLPGGFLAINRRVFDRLQEAYPGRGYMHGAEAFYAYFHAPIADGTMYGEDAAFCFDWTKSGGKVWLDPELSLRHVGSKTFEGHIGNWLKGRA